jgi:hypothetical protein
MADNKNPKIDSETILMTLDQINQTVEIMTSVVGRLRGYLTEQLDHNSTPEDNEEAAVVTHPHNSREIH